MHEACRPTTKLLAATLLLAVGCDASKKPPGADGNADLARAVSLSRAVEITGKMLARYREADSYTDNASYVEQLVVRSEGVEREMTYYEMSLAFARPNRIRVVFSEAVPAVEGSQQGFEFASDGELVRAVLPELPDQMVENPAPVKLDAANVLPDPLIAEKLLNRPLSEVFPQLAMLLNEGDEDEAAVFAHDSNPRMLADAELNGRACYRVATSNPDGTRVFWIDRDDHTLHRMELPVESHRRQMDPERMYLKFAVRIDFKNPTFDSNIDKPSFAIEPKEGVSRVGSFVLPAEPPAGQGAAIETEETETTDTAEDAKSAEEGESEPADEQSESIVEDSANDDVAEVQPEDAEAAAEEPADDSADSDVVEEENPARQSENPLRTDDAEQNAEDQPLETPPDR